MRQNIHCQDKIIASITPTPHFTSSICVRHMTLRHGYVDMTLDTTFLDQNMQKSNLLKKKNEYEAWTLLAKSE